MEKRSRKKEKKKEEEEVEGARGGGATRKKRERRKIGVFASSNTTWRDPITCMCCSGIRAVLGTVA